MKRARAARRLAMIMLAALPWLHPLRHAVADDDDDDAPAIAAPNRVSIVHGERVLVLDELTQVQNGIATAHPRPALLSPTVAVTGTVVDGAAVVDLYRRYRRARREAPALAPAVAQRMGQRFGAAVATGVVEPAPMLAAALAGRAALVELALPADRAPATLTAHGSADARVTLTLLGPAAHPGDSLYATAPGAPLTSGEAVTAALPLGGARAGVVVPAAAVVWWNGAPWVYRRRDGQLFGRVRLAETQARAGGDYWSAALAPDDDIVVRGAQRLLSEEFQTRAGTGD